MKRVFEQLKYYAENIDLSSRYDWDFDDSFLKAFSDLPHYFGVHYKNIFDRNIALKHSLTKYFQNEPGNLDLSTQI